MSKFTCLFLCVVAASISRVYAEAKEKARAILMECAKEHGVTEVDLKAAMEAHNLDNIKPCFMGCVYKKEGIINDKGEFNLDNALAQIKEFETDEKVFAKYADIGKKCTAVNEKPVSDGTAGCERSALLTACLLEHSGMITV